jgi:hypothetical protein
MSSGPCIQMGHCLQEFVMLNRNPERKYFVLDLSGDDVSSYSRIPVAVPIHVGGAASIPFRFSFPSRPSRSPLAATSIIRSPC